MSDFFFTWDMVVLLDMLNLAVLIITLNLFTYLLSLITLSIPTIICRYTIVTLFYYVSVIFNIFVVFFFSDTGGVSVPIPRTDDETFNAFFLSATETPPSNNSSVEIDSVDLDAVSKDARQM